MDIPEDVKPRRAYRSERRREQAEETRERVLEAAAAAVRASAASRARRSPRSPRRRASRPRRSTRGFRNKRTLLGELVRRAVRGGDAAPVLEQAGPRAVAAATDQREQLRLFAADIAAAARARRAAGRGPRRRPRGRDPELAELLAKIHGERLENLRTFVEALAANGPLRLEPEAALDDGLGARQPGAAPLLTRTRGWTRERYCDWLADSLAALLL